MQLLQDIFIIEQLQVLSEGKANGPMKIRGVFGRCNEKNNNGRIYPTAVLESQLSKVQPLINERRLCGELDHPQNDTVKLSNASHLITKLDMKGNELIGEAEILKTPAGLTAKALVEGGVKIGISSRGMGTLSEDHNGDKIVNEDFRLVTFDLVADPSTRGAFPGLSESTESKFVQESQTKLQKEGNFVTMLESKMRDAYDPWIEEAKKKSKKKLDPVGQGDADVNNDGAVDSTDSYLKNRRKAVGKAIKEEGSWHQIAYAVADALGHDVKKKVDEGFDDEVKKSKAMKGQRAEVRTSRAARISALRSKAVEKKAKKTAKKEATSAKATAKSTKAKAKAAEKRKKGVLKGDAPERRSGGKPDTGQRRRGEDKTFARRKRGPAVVDKATQDARMKQMTSHPNFEKALSNLQKDVNEPKKKNESASYRKLGRLLAENFAALSDEEARKRANQNLTGAQVPTGAGTPAAGFMARRRMVATGKAQGKADVAAANIRQKGQMRMQRRLDRVNQARSLGQPVRVSATRRALGGAKDAAGTAATGIKTGVQKAGAAFTQAKMDQRDKGIAARRQQVRQKRAPSNIEARNKEKLKTNLAQVAGKTPDQIAGRNMPDLPMGTERVTRKRTPAGGASPVSKSGSNINPSLQRRLNVAQSERKPGESLASSRKKLQASGKLPKPGQIGEAKKNLALYDAYYLFAEALAPRQVARKKGGFRSKLKSAAAGAALTAGLAAATMGGGDTKAKADTGPTSKSSVETTETGKKKAKIPTAKSLGQGVVTDPSDI
jgi:hypothetical protein